VGVQYVAAVTDSSVIDEDVHMPVTLQDLLRSSVHCGGVRQVEGDGAGSVSLVVVKIRSVKPYLNVIVDRGFTRGLLLCVTHLWS